MKKLVTCVLASAFLGACAAAEKTAEPSAADAARNAPKEDYVTGSRLRRSDQMENFQGTRGTTRGEEWQQYRGPTTLDGR